MKNEKSHLNLELRNVNIKLNCVLISSVLSNNEILFNNLEAAALFSFFLIIFCQVENLIFVSLHWPFGNQPGRQNDISS